METAAFVRALQRALWYAPRLTDKSEQIRIPRAVLRLFGTSPAKRVGGAGPQLTDGYKSSTPDTTVKVAGAVYTIDSSPMYVVNGKSVAQIDAHLALEDPLTMQAALVKPNAHVDQWIFDLLICDSKKPALAGKVYAEYRHPNDANGQGTQRDQLYTETCAQVLSAVTNADELNAVDEYTGGGLSVPVTSSLFARHYTSPEDFGGLGRSAVFLFLHLFGFHGNGSVFRSKDYRHLYGLGCEIALAISNLKRDLILPLVARYATQNDADQLGFPTDHYFVQLAHSACPTYGSSGAVVLAAFRAAYERLVDAETCTRKRFGVNLWRTNDAVGTSPLQLAAGTTVAPLSPIPGADLISQYVRPDNNGGGTKTLPSAIPAVQAQAYAKFLAEKLFLPVLIYHFKNGLHLNPRGRHALETAYTAPTTANAAIVSAQTIAAYLPSATVTFRSHVAVAAKYPGLALYDRELDAVMPRDAVVAELVLPENIAKAFNADPTYRYAIIAEPTSSPSSSLAMTPYELLSYAQAFERRQ